MAQDFNFQENFQRALSVGDFLWDWGCSQAPHAGSRIGPQKKFEIKSVLIFLICFKELVPLELHLPCCEALCWISTMPPPATQSWAGPGMQACNFISPVISWSHPWDPLHVHSILSSLHSALLVMWRPPPQMDLTFTFKEITRLPPDCQSFCRSQFFFIRPKILRQRLRLFFCYQIFLAYTDTLKTWEMSRYLEVLRRDTLSLYPSKSGRSPKEMGNGDSTHSIVSSCNCCLSWSISPPHSVTRRQTPLTTSIQCKCNDNKQIYVSFQSKMR